MPTCFLQLIVSINFWQHYRIAAASYTLWHFMHQLEANTFPPPPSRSLSSLSSIFIFPSNQYLHEKKESHITSITFSLCEIRMISVQLLSRRAGRHLKVVVAFIVSYGNLKRGDWGLTTVSSFSCLFQAAFAKRTWTLLFTFESSESRT